MKPIFLLVLSTMIWLVNTVAVQSYMTIVIEPAWQIYYSSDDNKAAALIDPPVSPFDMNATVALFDSYRTQTENLGWSKLILSLYPHNRSFV